MEADRLKETEIQTYKLSWLAYVAPALSFAVLVSIGIVALIAINTASFQMQIPHAFREPIFSIVICAVLAIYVVFFIFKIVYLRTLRLFLNENGVYMFRGVFPWTKGTVGTAWRDIADANYYTGFVSWVTKSYRIRIGHRFTKSSEMVIPFVKNGNIAVMTINEAVNNKFRGQA